MRHTHFFIMQKIVVEVVDLSVKQMISASLHFKFVIKSAIVLMHQMKIPVVKIY